MYCTIFRLNKQYKYGMIQKRTVIEVKKKVTFTVEEELVERLKLVSEQTMIPQSKLVEKAIEEILKEYEK